MHHFLNYSCFAPGQYNLNYIKMRFNILVGVLLLFARELLALTTINVPNGVTLSNYNTLVTNVLYTVNMTLGPPITVPANSIFTLQFSIHYTIDAGSVSNCQYSITGASYSATLCTTDFNSQNNMYQLNFVNIYPSLALAQSNLYLQFNITNPQLSATEHINTEILSGGSIIANGIISVVYTPSPLLNCSYTSNNDTTGVNSSRTIVFAPSMPVYSGSVFVITMPPWFGKISSHSASTTGGLLTCANISNSDSASPICSSSIYQDSLTSNFYEEFDVSGLIQSNKVMSSSISFSMASLRNPPSLAPFGPILFQLKILDLNSGGSYVTSQSCTNLYQYVTKMNIPFSVTFNIGGSLNISTTYSSKTAKLTIREPFPYVNGQLMLTFPTSVQMAYALLIPMVSTNTSMTFSSVATVDQTTTGTGFVSVAGLSIVTPPSSRPFTITLTDQVVQSGSTYGIDSNSLTYTCQTGPLTSASITPTSTNVNAITQYILGFTTSNALTSGSFVAINFPAELTATVGSCSTNNSAVTCSVTNSSYASLSITGSVPPGTAIKVTFPSVQNPKQALTTSSFQIYTYYDSGLDSMVDKVTSGITMISVANLLTTITVTPTSTVTYALTSYTFAVTLLDLIPANGYITILFPSTITLGTVALASASFSTATCTVQKTGNTIQLNSCFPTDMTNLTVNIVLSGVYNPPSLQPTTAFSFSTYGPLGLVDYITTGPTVTMVTPATTTTFTIMPLGTIVHSFQQYNLGFTFAVPHQVNDYFTLTIPSSMSFSASPTCSPNSGILSIACSLLNVTTIKITLSSVPSASAQIGITNIRNYDVGQTISFQVYFYNSGGYAMETTPSSSVPYSSTSITTFSINSNDQIALYENSNLTLTISTPFAMDSSFASNLTSLAIVVPSLFTVSANTTCSPLVGSCSIANSTFTVTSVGLSLTSFTVVIANIKLPYFSPTSTSFTVTYLYNGYQVATTNSGIVVSVFCASPCERCVSTQTACASCLPAPNTALYLYTVNSSCLSSCPNTFYINSSNICQTCNSPCLWCSDSVNCTKCNTTTFLYNLTCLDVCPSTFFGNASNICETCLSPCRTCTSNVLCTNCSINFLTNFSCVNASSCPAGTFGDTVTLTCSTCQSPCATCWNANNNCTSCVLGFVYFQNSCPPTCLDTYYNSTNVCTPCASPCLSCTSSTLCLNCTLGYLLGSSCVSAGNCSSGTYADNATKTCASCQSGCNLCGSNSTCSSCNSSSYLFNNTCGSSCPIGTYINGGSCSSCSANCSSCFGSANNCSSCPSPLLFSANTCVASCQGATYSNGSSCLTCPQNCPTCSSGSTCSTCSSGYYLSGSHCISSCPPGTYQDTITNNCSSCDPTCLTCTTTLTCTSCTPANVYYQGFCQATCPANYFNISGVCKTCSYCVSCLSYTLCNACLNGYYMLNSVCYSTCPAGAIADPVTMTCTQCNSSCATCSGSSTNCLSCTGGLYLLNGVCFSSCPTGYIATAGQCTVSTIGSIVYFPFSITFAVFFVILLYSKSNHPKTETITAMCGFLAFLVWISWLVLVMQANSTDLQLEESNRSIILGVGLVGIVFSIALGVIFAVWFRNYFRADNGFNEWACHSNNNLNVFRVVFFLTLFAFPCLRLIYCRFFNRAEFSSFFLKGEALLSASAKFAFVYILFCIIPFLYISGYVIYIKRLYDQTLINSIDSLLLDIILVILLIIDTNSKDDNYFNEMVEDQPYLKKLRYDELNNSISCIRDYDNQKERHKSELADREKEDYFRNKVNFIDDLNKFGHLNSSMDELPGRGRKLKTLPNQLENLPQFDANQDLNQEEINVVDEDFFFEEEERRRKREQQEQQEQYERMRLEEEERRRKEREDAEEAERQRKKKLMDDDMDEQHSVDFPDLAAIEKVEKKGENMKKSPTHILSNFKKVDDLAISEKDKKKLQDLAKKNNLDPQFMAETFGVEKHHNPELLNSIIDKHNHVDREAVKQFFSSSSNPEVLQELFSKKSTMDPQRLRELMNDPDSAEIIKNLVSAQDGIISPDIAKLLLDSNSKFTPQFVKELLKAGGGGGEKGEKGENGEEDESQPRMDPEKLKQLLKNQPDKIGREASLKAIKKLGGDNLQNKEIMKNLLGEDSPLETENFNRVATDLSRKVIEQLFGTKSATNDIIISKLLNNKKIDLKNLSAILEDPELLEELAKALSSGNEALEENLLNLFKNGEKLDPQLLKEFLSRPVLLEKLASKVVDPVFLSNLLKKDAKTDLSLLQKTIEQMDPDQIAQVFEYNPEKNVDFEKVSKLFEFNSKTDPNLIAELLDPEVVANIYNKSSSAKPQILNKLVEKGKRIDPESIVKIYGDDSKPNFRDTGKVGEEVVNKKYNITENNFNLNKQDFEDEMGFKKGANEINMSRTDGRMLGFLSPIQVGLQGNRKYSKNGRNAPNERGRNVGGMNPNDMDDIDDQEITEYNYGQGEKPEGDDDQYEIVEEGGKRRRRKKLKKKPLDDIRLPSEHIYLQRLEAPHELKKKNIRKKKKKVSSSMQQLEPMDEDNEVYDLDF